MDVKNKLIQLLQTISQIDPTEVDVCGTEYAISCAADYLISHGVTIIPAVPGPSVDDPNIMELCFHNGERHMKEKMIFLLDDFDKDYTCGDPYIDYDALRKAMMDL